MAKNMVLLKISAALVLLRKTLRVSLFMSIHYLLKKKNNNNNNNKNTLFDS